MVFQAQIPLSAEERWECEGSQTHLGQPGHLLLQTQPSGSLSKLYWSWKTNQAVLISSYLGN